MAYSTIIDLKKYMPSEIIQQLTDDHDLGNIITEIVDDAISSADNLINSFIEGRYPTDKTGDDIPPFINDISTKLTAYNLYRRKLMDTLPESIQKDYKFCMKILTKIQDGKLSPFEKADEPEVIKTNKTAASRIFNSAVQATY